MVFNNISRGGTVAQWLTCSSTNLNRGEKRGMLLDLLAECSEVRVGLYDGGTRSYRGWG